jgi:hypothetical protein
MKEFFAGSLLRRGTKTATFRGLGSELRAMIQQNSPSACATAPDDGGSSAAVVDVSRGTVSLQLTVGSLPL